MKQTSDDDLKVIRMSEEGTPTDQKSSFCTPSSSQTVTLAGSQAFPRTSPWDVIIWRGVVEETVKGFCVYADLKRMELVSSSSSRGRPSRRPQGVCSWRTPTPLRLGLTVAGRERNTEQNSSTSGRSQGKVMPRLQRRPRSLNHQKGRSVYLTTSQVRGSLNFIFDS